MRPGRDVFNLLCMETFLKIITLGLYGLFAKKRGLKQSVKKTKFRDDGTVKKTVERDTEYSEDEAPSPNE